MLTLPSTEANGARRAMATSELDDDGQDDDDANVARSLPPPAPHCVIRDMIDASLDG